MTEKMPVLLKHIHDALGNDQVTFRIETNEGVSSPATWNEREIVAYLTETKPSVASFFKKFKLSLR